MKKPYTVHVVYIHTHRLREKERRKGSWGRGREGRIDRDGERERERERQCTETSGVYSPYAPIKTLSIYMSVEINVLWHTVPYGFTHPHPHTHTHSHTHTHWLRGVWIVFM